MLDLLVRDGFMVDGSGLPGFITDVAVKDGLIVGIGRFDPDDACEVIDATGRVVSPGFVDPHTHVDPQLWWDSYALPLVLHGVTTVMTGNCAVTFAPCRAEDRDVLARLFYMVEEVPLAALRDGVPWNWESFGEYAAALRPRLGINCAQLVGHCAIRYSAMGPASYEREATNDEIGTMRELLRASLRAGATGFSMAQNKLHVGEGGIPIPSRLAGDAELFALADVLAEENTGLIQSDAGVDIGHRVEWIERVGGPIAARTGRLVLAGNVLAGLSESNDILAALAVHQGRGERIYAQANPARMNVFFTLEGSSILFVADCPSWTKLGELPAEQRLRRLNDPGQRVVLESEIAHSAVLQLDRVVIHRTAEARNHHLDGVALTDYAARLGKGPAGAAIDLALDEGLRTQFVREADERVDADTARQLTSPQALIGSSDAGAHVTTLSGAANTSIVLSKWVRERHLFSIEQAVSRLTFEPCRVLGFTNRGLLAPGYAADLVVFDADKVGLGPAQTVQDMPGGGERIWHDALGIDHVVVNGSVTVRDGQLTGSLAGDLIGLPATAH